ncbi:hypothetical protein XBFFL1_2170108 [Xenorhabdus bovienii str. feltiae Florida]|uniref:Uncharacterized protein n=1 Tax=Xenorhabdus bovienii str. feltiae Moldova TaxID=1398200 RepID=A0A077NUK8_XENBV|nr:hypothetical protein XBFFR1_2050005 [Xenorhabdus bovienii str. feltiae France]CDG92466.1 hypothetical protein XBFFL1_2170108 [Xenorhabdus bovienii str. feltiae Florida]CDH01241.1 hypothetical protein XBFM1_2050009 [Xenorhabdus bovienii str. feltiae Moldova]
MRATYVNENILIKSDSNQTYLAKHMINEVKSVSGFSSVKYID